MNVLVYLVPLGLMLGLTGLAAFLWSVKSGQYDDLDGAAVRILRMTTFRHPDSGSVTIADDGSSGSDAM